MAATHFFYRYKLHHLMFWLLVFGGWYYFRYEDYSSSAIAFRITLLKVADLALMVYLANYLLIPKLLYKKRYVLFGLSFFLMIAASSLLKMHLIFNVILNPAGSFLSLFQYDFKGRVYDNIIPHFLLVSTGAAFKLVLDYARAQRRLGELAKEKAEAELNFLKSQINPHFLFNSLNSVYFLIDKDNKEARQALHKFSDMLRYQLYEMNGEKIPVEKEISYLQDYIALQRLRQNDNSSVSLHVAPDTQGFYIEPLLLVPFVENSFKHLSHYNDGKKNEIKINLSRQNGTFNFSVRNTTEGKKTPELLPQGGIGLANVKRRLELLYPQRHQLAIQEQEGWFDVQLTLKIQS
ncbi:MAG: sensor histidine kinase [Flavisolibacter sp.]|nr:sensor histidine kinase [Flavisolibacter sp.]